MHSTIKPIAFVLALSLSTAPAGAQLGGLGGLLKGGGLPDISATGAGNAAGLLSYCVKNQLLGRANTDNASSALSALVGKPGVAGSASYKAGQTGTVVTNQGQNLSIGNLGGNLKSQLCGMVLQHAKALL